MRHLGDKTSPALLKEILVDEEEHVDYLERQLHARGQMGVEKYLAQQMHKGDDDWRGTRPFSLRTRAARDAWWPVQRRRR